MKLERTVQSNARKNIEFSFHYKLNVNLTDPKK
jgi:hypothetical protein